VYYAFVVAAARIAAAGRWTFTPRGASRLMTRRFLGQLRLDLPQPLLHPLHVRELLVDLLPVRQDGLFVDGVRELVARLTQERRLSLDFLVRQQPDAARDFDGIRLGVLGVLGHEPERAVEGGPIEIDPSAGLARKRRHLSRLVTGRRRSAAARNSLSVSNANFIGMSAEFLTIFCD
jgi:hypothetical protein